MSRILSIDHGEVRIGLALSDPMRIISSPFKTIQNKGDEIVLAELKQIISENEVELIILGHPMGLNGQKTKKTEHVEKFAEKLKEFEIEIVLFDESFSTVRAHQIVHEMGKKTGNSKDIIDSLAAQVILEDYLKTLG